MILYEHLKKNDILIDTKSKNRWELIQEMVDLAIKNGDIDPREKAHIISALTEREKSMSTGIGNGVAIPHCIVSSIDNIVTIMAISSRGIDFDSIDNIPVKIAILLLVPKSKLSQHIKTLANIAKLMSDEHFREKLLSIKSPDGILKELKKYNKK